MLYLSGIPAGVPWESCDCKDFPLSLLLSTFLLCWVAHSSVYMCCSSSPFLSLTLLLLHLLERSVHTSSSNSFLQLLFESIASRLSLSSEQPRSLQIRVTSPSLGLPPAGPVIGQWHDNGDPSSMAALLPLASWTHTALCKLLLPLWCWFFLISHFQK